MYNYIVSDLRAALYEYGNGKQLGCYIGPTILEAMRIWGKPNTW